MIALTNQTNSIVHVRKTNFNVIATNITLLVAKLLIFTKDSLDAFPLNNTMMELNNAPMEVMRTMKLK